MSDTVLVQACAADAVDAVTGTCTQPVWVVYESSPLPTLSAQEGAQIGTAIVVTWAVGLAFRSLRKAIW